MVRQNERLAEKDDIVLNGGEQHAQVGAGNPRWR
jgi:hypothetical protein